MANLENLLSRAQTMLLHIAYLTGSIRTSDIIGEDRFGAAHHKDVYLATS